jgi:uncharacterized protein YrrD
MGMPVVEESTGDVLGTLAGCLIQPDTGVIEGFIVKPSGLFFHGEPLFLSRFDIVHWGRVVRVRDHHCLTTPDEIIRLQPLLRDPRTVLGQRMRTEGGAALGTCRDVQLNTKTFVIEWLFPRAWLRWGLPVPVGEVVEIRPEVIVIRDPGKPKIVKREEPTLLEKIEELAEAPVPVPPAPS